MNIAEYAGSIGDAKNRESQTREQERILELVDRFWFCHVLVYYCQCNHQWTAAYSVTVILLHYHCSTFVGIPGMTPCCYETGECCVLCTGVYWTNFWYLDFYLLTAAAAKHSLPARTLSVCPSDARSATNIISKMNLFLIGWDVGIHIKFWFKVATP